MIISLKTHRSTHLSPNTQYNGVLSLFLLNDYFSHSLWNHLYSEKRKKETEIGKKKNCYNCSFMSKPDNYSGWTDEAKQWQPLQYSLNMQCTILGKNFISEEKDLQWLFFLMPEQTTRNNISSFSRLNKLKWQSDPSQYKWRDNTNSEILTYSCVVH